MKNKVGLWIDHRKAVIVTIVGEKEEIKELTSGMENHVRFSGAASADHAGEDTRDRQFENHLTDYYEKIVGLLGDAESIHIFGPGEAKGELEAVLKKKNPKARISASEPADKMTDRQIAAKVREYFKHEL